MGIEGLIQLKKTMDYLHGMDKKAFTIADAKRGDIGKGMGVIACGVLSSVKIHYGVADTFDTRAMEESIALLCDYTGDEAFVGIIVEDDGVGHVFGIALLEEWTSLSRTLWLVGYRQSLFIQINRSKALLIKDVFLFVNMNYRQ